MSLVQVERPVVAHHILPSAPPAPTTISSTTSSAMRVPAAHRRRTSALLPQIPTAAAAMRERRHTLAQSLPDTVYLLDWDDTCCSTTYLEWYGIMADLDTRLSEVAPAIDAALRALEQRVLALLKAAAQLGSILIITNAGEGWVELSSERFLPAVKKFLDDHYRSVKIVSARARYIDQHRSAPWRWKALTFVDELKNIAQSRRLLPFQLNVVVLGDSPGDRYAAYESSNAMAKAGLPITLKIVKFLERPTVEQLCKQLSVLLDHLHVMTRHNGSFEVSMSNEQQQQQHQQQQSHHPVENNCSNSTDAPEGVDPESLSYHPYSSSASSTCSTESSDSMSSADTATESMSTASSIEEDTDVPCSTHHQPSAPAVISAVHAAPPVAAAVV